MLQRYTWVCTTKVKAIVCNKSKEDLLSLSFVCVHSNVHMKNFCLLLKWQSCRYKGNAGPKVRAIA